MISAEQYEALAESSKRQYAVAAALASVRAEGLEPRPEDLELFASVAAASSPPTSCGPVSCVATLSERSQRRRSLPRSRQRVLRNRLGITDADELAAVEAALTASRLIDLERHRLPGAYDLAHLQAFHRYIFGDVYDWAEKAETLW